MTWKLIPLVGVAAILSAAAAPALPTAPGATADQVAKGEKLFAGGTCVACHGEEGMGADMGPALDTGAHQWSDGSLEGIHAVIVKGVEKPRQFSGPMPPLGGMTLTADEQAAVSAYVWALGHKAAH